jgi:hypothetical protein
MRSPAKTIVSLGVTAALCTLSSTAAALAITLTQISTTFNTPVGIDHHAPTNSVVVSVNYPSGSPLNFERIQGDGSHVPFSTISGFSDEVKIATVRPGNVGGFVSGDLFTGNGIDGQVARITNGGATVINPFVDLPGAGNGLMRGSLYVDRTGVYGGDLVVATTTGQVWRITSAGTPTMIANVGVHLEGLLIVPNNVALYGPLAGKIIAGAEGVGLLYVFDATGFVETRNVGVAIEDIDLITPNENFFGVNFGTSRILGAPAAEFTSVTDQILLTSEFGGSAAGLWTLRWDGTNLISEEITLSPGSASRGQWEHVTFSPAGIREIPPVPDGSVPEPGTLLLLAPILALLARRKR